MIAGMPSQWRFTARFPAILLALTVLTLATPGWAQTAASPWVSTDFADVRLISASAGMGRGESARDRLPLGLHFRLADGWKIYWRSPGDAGYPPEIDWSGSENLGQVSRQWPLPERFSLFGLETFGYKHEVVLPMEVAPREPGKPVHLRAAINALACSDICVPLEAKLALSIGDGPPTATPFAQLISRFRAQVPSVATGDGLRIEAVSAVGDPVPHSLEVVVRAREPMASADVFAEAGVGFTFGKPTVRLSEAGHLAHVVLPASVPKDRGLLGQRMTFTATDGTRFSERTLTVTAPTESSGSGAAWLALAGMLGVAYLGGLILNLMPCVLPVLSLKLLSVVKYGGAARGAVRRGFLASAAGIVASFLILGGGAIALKQAGLAVGWGIQFQQPIFLVAMALLVTAFAANLFGLFEIPLPRWLGGLSGGGAADSSLGGHFATGVFATLLATPCSAPFVGTAIGFALARGSLEIAVLFAVMGLGLATPYLTVAALPGLARALPRPGQWMITLRRMLAFALLATTVWLLTVIDTQVGRATAALIAALLLGAFAALALGRWRQHRLGATAAVLLSIAALGLAFRPPDNVREPASESQELNWVAFDQSELDEAVAAGKVVLVDVTADWCITCKVNKSLVLLTGPVGETLASGAVLAMKADWTLPDPMIADYLASFGRYGIPFNAVYGPAAPRGIPLPEILSEEAVLKAFEAAG